MRAAALALLCACALLPALPTAAARPAASDALGAVEALAAQRGVDGRFDPGLAPLVVEAAVAVGVDAAHWPDGTHSALASLPPLNASAPLISQVRAIHARAVAGRGTPQDTAYVEGTFHDGQFGDPVLLNDDLWAVRALLALGVPTHDGMVQAAAQRLVAEQDPGGGWSWRLGGGPSSDVTGMALVALAEAQVPAPAGAAGYLARTHDNATGGYAEDAAGGAANCDSTVWAIRGLHALGQGAPADTWAYLARLHQDGGGFAYQPGQGANALCTAEAAALLGEWRGAGRDLSAYAGAGAARSTPGLSALPALALALTGAARRRRA